MEKEFVSYEIALALKELGFDEPCFACYGEDGQIIIRTPDYRSFETNNESNIIRNFNLYNNGTISAPTFSQAFRFFREKYNVQCSIIFYSESLGIKKIPNHYEIQIDYLSNNKWCYFENISNKILLSYEEAELECLKKLIEIVKEKNE